MRGQSKLHGQAAQSQGAREHILPIKVIKQDIQLNPMALEAEGEYLWTLISPNTSGFQPS